jgi:hypothetical protein
MRKSISASAGQNGSHSETFWQNKNRKAKRGVSSQMLPTAAFSMNFRISKLSMDASKKFSAYFNETNMA